jgi:3-dehydroquinate dehydratase type I
LQVADKFMKFMSGRKPETCKLIVSSHNYDNTPSAEELAELLAQIQATGADIVKIATTATEIVDVSRMFQILVHCQVSSPSSTCAISVFSLSTSISCCCFLCPYVIVLVHDCST